MNCGKCKTKLVRIKSYVCPKCGNEMDDFKDRTSLEKEKQKYRKKRKAK